MYFAANTLVALQLMPLCTFHSEAAFDDKRMVECFADSVHSEFGSSAKVVECFADWLHSSFGNSAKVAESFAVTVHSELDSSQKFVAVEKSAVDYYSPDSGLEPQ